MGLGAVVGSGYTTSEGGGPRVVHFAPSRLPGPAEGSLVETVPDGWAVTETDTRRSAHYRFETSRMSEKHYGYGPWEYRHMCKSCGHAVKAPKHEVPCSRCGGDFGVKISMRKVYLEPEQPPETVEVEYELELKFWDRIK